MREQQKPRPNMQRADPHGQPKKMCFYLARIVSSSLPELFSEKKGSSSFPTPQRKPSSPRRHIPAASSHRCRLPTPSPLQSLLHTHIVRQASSPSLPGERSLAVTCTSTLLVVQYFYSSRGLLLPHLCEYLWTYVIFFYCLRKRIEYKSDRTYTPQQHGFY